MFNQLPQDMYLHNLLATLNECTYQNRKRKFDMASKTYHLVSLDDSDTEIIETECTTKDELVAYLEKMIPVKRLKELHQIQPKRK